MDTTGELEPFMKNGLKLLRQTKNPDSMKQMLKHLEDAMLELYGPDRRPTNAAKNLSVPTALLSKAISIEQTEGIGKDESSSSSPITTTSKSIVEVCSSLPPTITLEQAKADPVINIDSDSEMETDVESYSCFVCKEVVNIGNSSVECIDCHSMYHKNCHTPPLTDINLNNPQLVWYCGNCCQKDSQKVDSRASGKESKKNYSKSSKGEEPSGIKSSNSTKVSSSESKSSSANSSPKHCPPTTSAKMSAMEKRVQMMKKKAVKKTEKKK